ncbi:hypothetical protein Pst134EB_020276 [Puccinia striiformis f. sp. tritici]|nr:hypothetical protein Pst134EB_020276 [Puccinia striiformis f. sp. tritici]
MKVFIAFGDDQRFDYHFSVILPATKISNHYLSLNYLVGQQATSFPHDQQAIHTGHQLLSANPLSDRCLHHSDASFAFDLRQNMPASPLIFVKTFGHLQGIHSSTPADSSGLR